MEEDKRQERNLELRSEKVRSIVGQIPSSLVRYGITIIGIVLLSLFAIAYLLPYKQIYSGTATILTIDSVPSDSSGVKIFLKFENTRPTEVKGQKLLVKAQENTIEGELLNLSPIRDTLDRQEAYCRFHTSEIILLENQTVDFQIIYSSGPLLERILGGI